MLARVTTIAGLPEHPETAVPVFQQSVDEIQELAGFEGAYLLVDRDEGSIMTLTLWNNPADVDSSAATAERIVAEAAERAGASAPARVQTYEVLLEI